MVYARNSGDGLTFRQVYESSFDGSTSFSYKNSFLSNTNQFSLYLNITPTVTSARQVIFSFGDSDSTTVLFEIGISVNNKAFFYDGTTETEIDLGLVSGLNYRIEYVLSNGSVTIYLNDITINVGFSNDLNSNDIVIGASVDGTGDYYNGYLNDVNVFNNAHNYKDVSVVTGGSYNWSPADVLGANGVWYSLTESGLLVRNTQPVLVDGDMEAVGTAAWDAPNPGGSLSKVAGPWLRISATAVSNPFTRHASGPYITGNRIHLTGTARGDGSLAPHLANDPYSALWTGTASVSSQPYDVEFTAASTGVRIYGWASGLQTGHGDWGPMTAENLSVTTATPKAATGSLVGANLVQATAAAMPWWDGTGVSSTTDTLVSSLAASAWRFTHDGTGSTMVFPYMVLDTNGHVHTTTLAAGSPGFYIYATTTSVRVVVSNGSGTFPVDTTYSGAAISAGVNVLAVRVQSGSNGVNIKINGTDAGSFDLLTPGLGDASFPFRLGNAAGSGRVRNYGAVVCKEYLSDAAVGQIGAFLASAHGGTWA